MNDVAKRPHLLKRGDNWYYRRRVPTHLVQALGRTEIKCSLGTSSLGVAKRLCAKQDVKTDELFAAAERLLRDGTAVVKAENGGSVSMDLVTEYIRNTVVRLDKRSADELLSEPFEDEEQRREVIIEHEIDLQILTNPSDPRAEEYTNFLGKRILQELNIELDPATPDFVRFWELIRRATIELTRRKLDRFSDTYNVPFHDSLFDPARQPSIKFSELVDTFLTERREEYDLNNVSPKRYDKIQAAAETVKEIVGADTPVHGIDDDIVQRVRYTLAKLPAKAYSPGTDIPALTRSTTNASRVTSTPSDNLRTLVSEMRF